VITPAETARVRAADLQTTVRAWQQLPDRVRDGYVWGTLRGWTDARDHVLLMWDRSGRKLPLPSLTGIVTCVEEHHIGSNEALWIVDEFVRGMLDMNMQDTHNMSDIITVAFWSRCKLPVS
jgi:hypothetical protein